MPNLSTDQIAQVAYAAGFRGQALQWMTQIAMRESGGNPGAYNPNAGTGDNSWGLWQINTLGSLGPARRKMLQEMGYSGSFEDLKNPLINAKVAFRLSQGGTNFEPWRSRSPGWEGPQGWLTNTQKFEQAAKQSAIRVQMGKASSTTSWQNGIKAAQSGNGSFFTKLTGWVNQQLGKPYKFGSIGPDTFDCSGLITAAYRQMGINVPALTFSQKNYGVQVDDPTDLQPGDLLLTHGAQGDYGHVGMYVGGGQVIDAPHTGAVVRTTSVDSWIPRVTGQGGMVRRLVDAQGRVITGSGLTPAINPDVQTVSFTEMSKGMIPAATDLTDVLGNSSTPQASRFTLARQPTTSLPGLGRTVAL